MDTLAQAFDRMDINPADVDLIHDSDNECWVLVNRSTDYMDPDHDPQATIAVFPAAEAGCPLAEWLVQTIRRTAIRDEAA